MPQSRVYVDFVRELLVLLYHVTCDRSPFVHWTDRYADTVHEHVVDRARLGTLHAATSLDAPARDPGGVDWREDILDTPVSEAVPATEGSRGPSYSGTVPVFPTQCKWHLTT